MEEFDTLEEGSPSSGKRERSGLVAGELIDHFRVVRALKRGGMGEVYLARDTKLGRKVAIKLIRGERLHQPGAIGQFLREAQVTARFSHPNIITIHAVGEHKGQPFLALEFLPGESLRERLRNRPPGLKESLRIALAIAEASAEAHRHGVLHLDLKPSNVLIPQDGRPRVLDFGLSRLIRAERAALHDLDGDSEDSIGNTIFGTPAYMAPEQWRGDAVTPAADVWAFGLIVFEMIAGGHPLRGQFKTKAEFANHICSTEPMPRLVEQNLPLELASLVDRCLLKSSSDRPSSEHLVEQLRDMVYHPRSLPASECPYRGLLPFTSRHADLFFGREREITAFVERMWREPVMPIIGASGIGKSSFVQAGVLPRLKEQARWLVLETRPGLEPFRTLADRVLHWESDKGEGSAWEAPTVSMDQPLSKQLFQNPARLGLQLHRLAEEQRVRVVLFVDQLEELFTLTKDQEVQKRYIRAIMTAADDHADPIRVIFTVRDDFLSRIAQAGETVREALKRVTVLQRPEPEALKEILMRPIAIAGCTFEDPALVEEMVAEVSNRENSLPLLQFAARRLWDMRDKERIMLTRESYRKIGGVAGALATHGDGVLDGMTERDAHCARQILLRLVTAERTRKVVPKEQILEGLQKEAQKVLDRLIESRLISTLKVQGVRGPQAMVELAHEALIYSWRRLSAWLESSKAELDSMMEISLAADLWKRRGRRSDEVWRGKALRQAVDTVERSSLKSTSLVAAFLLEGQRLERQRLFRKRALYTAALVLLSISSVSLLIQNREATEQRERAERARANARVQHAQAEREAATLALARGKTLEAGARLRTSMEVQDSTLSRALWWQLQQDPQIWSEKLSGPIWGADISADGQMIAAGTTSGALYLMDTTTKATRVLRGHQDQIMRVVFSPDGTRLASASTSGMILIWSLEGELLRKISAHQGAVKSLAYLQDGRTLVSAGRDLRVRLWRADGALIRTLKNISASAFALLPGEDPQLIIGARDRSVRVFRLEDARPVRRLTGHRAIAEAIVVSPNGDLFASAADRTIRIWSSNGESRVLKNKHQTISLAFSGDGQRLLSADRDGVVRFWSVKEGRLESELKAHEGPAQTLRYSADGRFFISGGADRALRLWRTESLPKTALRNGHTDAVLGLAFSPDGALLASASYDRTVHLWETKTGRVRRTFGPFDGVVWSVDFSPDGRQLAWGTSKLYVADLLEGGPGVAVENSPEGLVRGVRFDPSGRYLAAGGRRVRLYGAEDHALKSVLKGHRGNVLGTAFSTHGSRLASSSADGTVRLWRTKSGQKGRVLRGHSGDVWDVVFDARDRFLASSSGDGTLRLWDLKSGAGRILGHHPSRVYWMDISPDGQTIGTSNADGIVRLWDVQTGGHRALPKSDSEINAVRFSRKGLAFAGDSGAVHLWEPSAGRLMWRTIALLSSEGAMYTHEGRFDLKTAQRSPKKGAWQSALLQARFAVEVPNSAFLCVATAAHLEIWDRDQDARIMRIAATPETLHASEFGCVTLENGRAGVYAPPEWSFVPLLDGVTAIGHRALLVVQGRKLQRYDRALAALEVGSVGQGATAVAFKDGAYFVGYREGSVEIWEPHTKKRTVLLYTPVSAVSRILPGNNGLVLVGYRDGTVGMWHQESGAALHRARLHGAVLFLAEHGAKVWAATKLGGRLSWDLEAFTIPRCTLLGRIAKAVPVVWAEGRLVRSALRDVGCSP